MLQVLLRTNIGLEPTVDGTYVPSIPSVGLLNGAYDRNLSLMVGHNLNEGRGYTSPLATTSDALGTFMSRYLPAAAPSVISYIESTLYPQVYDGTFGYTSPFDRLNLAISEMMISCNARFLNTAFSSKAYGYFFTGGTGYHGADLVYTFFNEGASGVNATLAKAMQHYFTGFAATSLPGGLTNINNLPDFLPYGAGAMLLEFGDAGINRVHDPTENVRCSWWQLGLYA